MPVNYEMTAETLLSTGPEFRATAARKFYLPVSKVLKATYFVGGNGDDLIPTRPSFPEWKFLILIDVVLIATVSFDGRKLPYRDQKDQTGYSKKRQ